MVPEAGIEPARRERRGILKAVSAVNKTTISLILKGYKSVRVTQLHLVFGYLPPSLRLDDYVPCLINLALITLKRLRSISLALIGRRHY